MMSMQQIKYQSVGLNFYHNASMKVDDSALIVAPQKFQIGQIIAQVEAASVCGGMDVNGTKTHQKPNEDAFACIKDGENLWILVADGSTSLDPIKKIEDQFGISAARYASHFIASDINNLITNPASDKTNALTMLKAINANLFKNCEEIGLNIDLNNPYTTPMTTATLIKIDAARGVISIAHTGDSFAFTSNGIESELHTRNIQGEYEEVIFKRMREIAQTKGISVKDARWDPEIVDSLLDMLRSNYCNPNGKGFGVLNGFPSAELYMQFKEIPLQGITSLFVGSDGIVPLTKCEVNESDRQLMFKISKEQGVTELIKLVKSGQNQDADWTLEPRWKHSDDSTGINVTLR